MEMVAEMGAYGRVAMPSENISPSELYDRDISDIYKIVYRNKTDLKDRLSILLNIFLYGLTRDGVIHMSASQKSDMFKVINKIYFIEYKNPICLILGYYCIDTDDKTVNKTMFNKLKSRYAQMRYNTTFKMPDILRYCRLILSYIT